MHIANNLSEKAWRDVVEQHPQSNVFHTPEMFRVFAHTEGYQPGLWAATEGGCVLALMLPVRITLLTGLPSCLTTRTVAYGSVLCASGIEGREALKMLLHTYTHQVKAKPLFTELRNLSDLSSIQPILQNNGFAYADHLNYLIDLRRPVEEIWHSVDGDVRTGVRKARRMGVVIEEVTSLDRIPDVYAVLQRVYARIQIPLAHLSLFESAFSILYPLGMIKILVAQVENTCIGAAVRLLYRDVIYAWYAGIDRDYSRYRPNELLNWHIIEWGAQNGFSCFDLGGAGKPGDDYGPRKFKAKFGGTMVNYGRNTFTHAPVRLKLSEVGYQLARRFL